MADSEWESIRRKTRNRIRYGFGIGFPVLFLAGFLFYNNRDLFSSSVQSDDTAKQIDTTVVKSIPDSAAGSDSVLNNPVSVESRDSTIIKKNSVAAGAVSETKKTAKNNVVDTPATDAKPEVTDDLNTVIASGTSLVLSSIHCRTADQNGPVLNLSVELLSTQSAIEKKILIMRDELRVLIQSIVRSKEVSTLSREQLKTEIVVSVNKYIGKEVFNNLKFTEFKVEKVLKK